MKVLDKGVVYIVLEHATEDTDCVIHGVFTRRREAEQMAEWLNRTDKNWQYDLNTGWNYRGNNPTRRYAHGYVCVLKKPILGPAPKFTEQYEGENYKVVWVHE